MSMQRTAIQVISTGGLYGAERCLLELAAYLQEQGWRSHIIAVEGQGAGALVDRAKSMNLSAEAFALGRLGVGEIVGRLRAELRQREAGVVHSHGYKPDILLSLPGVASGWRRLSTCHTWYRETWKMRTWEWLDKRVLRGFDGVVAVSSHIERELHEARVPAARIRKIDNGIEAPRRDPALGAAIRAEFGIAADVPVVVQLGRLAPAKRNDIVIDSLSRLPPATQVIFAGDGPERAALERRVAAHGLDARVHFAGFRTDVIGFLSAANVLAISSDHEGLPIVLLEAMAAGCPVVSTRVGEIAHVLRDGQDAWLVPPADARLFAAALAEACSNPQAAAARADSARAVYERKHSRAAMGRQYLELYEADFPG
jgi:glycosyltransferase involved in cell wall biosynthesis